MTIVEIITAELDARVERVQAGVMPIVVATDGSEASVPALIAARLICEKTGAPVHVVSINDQPNLPASAPDRTLLSPDFASVRKQAQLEAIGNLKAQFDPAGLWTTEVRTGHAAPLIADVARDRKAALIIVGASRHGLLGRLLGFETAMKIAKCSDTPLLIASSSISSAPKRAVIAMNIDPNGMQCISPALIAVGRPRSITCVHVQPRSEFADVGWAEFDGEYDFALNERFGCLAADLGRTGPPPELVVLHGYAVDEVVGFAEETKADLIVVGIRLRQGRSAAIGGKIARGVLRQSSRSVLIVPGFMAE